MKIREKFLGLEPFFVGNPRQFLIVAGSYYCVRSDCEECPHKDKGCVATPEKISTALIPPARRAIGFEETPFLVLRLKPGKEFRPLREGEVNPDVVPVSLWSHDREHHCLDERNLHFVMWEPTAKFRVLKGQFRYYGTAAEFEASPYREYFTTYDRYEPSSHVVAFDFSAIEPRGSAIATREPEWIKIYDGVPKVVVRRVECNGELPPSIVSVKGHTYCILLGELDKANFEYQCKSCKNPCKVLQEYRKNVPGDFHSLNAKAFFSEEPDYPKVAPGEALTQAQKDVLAAYRDVAKVSGLAAVYGATAWTFARNMGCPEAVAQRRLDNFFANLPLARRSMLLAEQAVKKTGKVANFFNRIRDVSRWIHSKAPTEKERRSDVAFGVRIAYNHPIQSSMAEILKLAMIFVDALLTAKNYAPLNGRMVPQKFPLSFICNMLLSIHDELDFAIKSDSFDTILPELYAVLQVRDIIKSLGVDFLLEMDVEYDATRSFTATTKYPNARIFLVNDVLPRLEAAQEPNILVIDSEKITKEILDKVEQISYNTGVWFLGVRYGSKIWVAPHKVDEKIVEEWGVPFRKAYWQK